MTNQTMFKEIATDMQLFREVADKERFIFIVGALTIRLISLRKAAEVMEMDTDTLLKILDLMGVEFSYLGDEDAAIESTSVFTG